MNDSDEAAPDWDVVKEILADALERSPETRSAFLDAACGENAALRAEVVSLLGEGDAAAEPAGGFLNRPATAIFDVPSPEVGSSVGGYRLRSVIGEGGMGRVFEAEQERPHRTVALKVLRPGFLSPDSEKRFQWEIEALGRLSHAGIASVIEAGVEATEAGHAISWFAMEKVDGKPFLAAADSAGLDRRARLILFLRVADAIAHAHQRGVIHRDLKPDNILVDADGRPHVLDFGIARAADPMASAVTTAGEIVGTLAYMSPEQVLGEPDKVDAQSDVYALGVLLYRLLTGEAPLQLDGLSLPNVALTLSRDDPRPAGELDRTLRGDLETILQTALAREPSRRYPTVDAFAADIKRSMDDEPIAARPPTALYQLSKFTRRHKGLVAGLSLAFLASIGAAVGTGIGLVKANTARDLARAETTRADRARDTANIERDRAQDANVFLGRVLASASPEVDGRDVQVVDLLDAAMAELLADAELDIVVRAGLFKTLGETYRSLGFQAKARVALERAIEGFHAETPHGLEASAAHGALAEVTIDLGDIKAADLSMAYVDRGLEEAIAPPDWLRMRPLELRAARALRLGDTDEQMANSKAVFEAWRELLGEGHNTVEIARTNYSNALNRAGQNVEADELLVAGIAAVRRELGDRNVRVLTMLANRALIATTLGEWGRADEITQELLPTAIEVWGPAHPKTIALRSTRASVVRQLGDLESARDIYEENAERASEAYGREHAESILARHNVANVSIYLEDHARAETIATENLEILLADEESADPFLVLQTRMALANALNGLGRFADALPAATSVVEQLSSLAGESHPQTLISRNTVVTTLMKLERFDESIELGARNLVLAEESQPGNRLNMFPFRSNLGRALAAAGRFEQALEELHAVEEFLRGDPSVSAKETLRIRELLTESYEAWGKPAEAERWRD